MFLLALLRNVHVCIPSPYRHGRGPGSRASLCPRTPSNGDGLLTIAAFISGPSLSHDYYEGADSHVSTVCLNNTPVSRSRDTGAQPDSPSYPYWSRLISDSAC